MPFLCSNKLPAPSLAKSSNHHGSQALTGIKDVQYRTPDTEEHKGFTWRTSIVVLDPLIEESIG